MLGYLLLYRWAKQNRRIVVIKPALPVLLFCLSGVYELDMHQMQQEMARDDIRCVHHPTCASILR